MKALDMLSVCHDSQQQPPQMTATTDVEVSVVCQPQLSSRRLSSFNSHTPPAQPSYSTTIPRDTVKGNQAADGKSGVKYCHEAGTNNNSQTDDWQFEVSNGNEAVENKNSQTDDEQSGITHSHKAGATKPASQ